MRDGGKSIIIITHKLHEVLSISDRVAVLRKGEYIATVDTREATELSLTEMMVGKKVKLNIERPEPVNPVKRIEVRDLTVVNAEGIKALDDVSFDLCGGEILGIAGISGCGQKELLEAIAGLQKTESGSSVVFYPTGDSKDAKSLIGKTPKEIRDYGITLSFVPEDRLGMGLVGSMGIPENMMLKTYNDYGGIFLNLKDPMKSAQKLKTTLDVATPSLNTPVRTLSGGNIQKVLVGREISSVPSVLMTAYAVRGLDINTSYMIYDLINAQKKKGVAVIFVGEDLDVLLAISDRILVLCGGRCSGIIDARTTTKEQIGLLMTTIHKQEAETENGK
jgi:simple sugar transport system ATP-binding protein